jgi:plasmid stabilization system protein ParE
VNRVNIQPLAIADAEHAEGWYEAQRPGLGLEFILEIDVAIETVARFPEMYALQYRQTRRVLLRRFPYAMYFTFDNDVVEVFAILHLRRESAAWQQRQS